MEVRALKVGHGLKALLPYGVLLIPNQEQRDRKCCYSSEAVLAQGGESDLCYHLDAGVGLTTKMNPDHGSMWSKGIITLTSHLSKPWTLDTRHQ
jgi:hypothetical protein